jgi:hypothetical protein
LPHQKNHFAIELNCGVFTTHCLVINPRVPVDSGMETTGQTIPIEEARNAVNREEEFEFT